uniref:Isoleucyl-tRNA synthetase 2, mitochondrial n=1 Tax=Salmo trutta TaxID=8032 RepID=A0A673Y1C2_SALTR
GGPYHNNKPTKCPSFLAPLSPLIPFSPSIPLFLPLPSISPGRLFRRQNYATFTLVNLPPKMAEAAGELGNISVLVWTTQPWTIPANQAININKNLFLTDLATECVSSLAILLGTELESVGTFTGAELEGTGLVHTAPAHGMEDYSVASQFELTVECMVDEEGRFNELAGPELQNQSVMGEGNYTVISMLKAVRALVKEEECVHSYPDDRGSKQPVDGLAKMRVMPESARGSLFAQLDRRPSWCISHQRSWGMPIPVFYHIETGEPLMNNDCWWELPLESLLPPEVLMVSHCSVTDYERGVNVLDIWFDSGTSWAAVFEGESFLSLRALVVHDFVVSEKGEKVLCNLVDPDTAIHGGKDPSVPPAYEADVLLWWVAKSNVFSEVQICSTVLNSARDNIDKVSLSWCLLCVSVGLSIRLKICLSVSFSPCIRRSCPMVLEAILDAVTRSISPIVSHLGETLFRSACAIRDSFLSSIPGRSAAEYELTIEIEPGLLLSYTQLTELMVSSWTTLNSALPRDVPFNYLIFSNKKLTFLPSVQSDGVIHEDSAYQVAAVPTSMVRCPRCRRYTSVSPDCPCQIILTRAQ